LKWFRNHFALLLLTLPISIVTAASVVLILGGRDLQIRAASTGLINYGAFHDWLQNTEAGSAVESALYRLMTLPTGDVLYRRPPQESRPELNKLLSGASPEAALYSLRALQDEQALDFTAAEKDWKLWVDHAPDRTAAELDLATFYGRRLRPQQEIASLTDVARAPSSPSEKFTQASEQRSWQAFEEILRIAQEDGLKPEIAIDTYQKWIERYPVETSVYSRYFDFLLAQKRFDQSSALIAQYSRAFPQDTVFTVKAQASLAYRRGSLAEGLAVYDKAFQPLWPAELIQSYYNLLTQTHTLAAFLDQTRARLAANPDDLDAASRLFYAYQHQGRLDAARQVIAAYRQSKESRGAHWSGQELYTFARLLESVQDGPEAARYYYALNNSAGMADAQQYAIGGLIAILLDAPEQPMRLGAGNLSMYRDIATMDQGPGYLNGILSLLLNTSYPKNEYVTEDQLASPYFHRAKAAELLAEFDRRFADAPDRSSLHARLIRAYAVYGENDSVIRAGTEFLTQFPNAPERVEIALAVADADARTDRTQDEFAVYDRLLRELAAQAQGVPLGDRTQRYSQPVQEHPAAIAVPSTNQAADAESAAGTRSASSTEQNAFATQTASPSVFTIRSSQYEQVLDRYLSRLVALKQLPQALTVLRGEVDHDPDDPGIYQKLADFLDQNRLGEQEEEVYRRAIQQFDDKGWYDKLARYYVRHKRNADYASLTADVAKIFSGTELESYFASAPAPGAQLSLQVNLYAHNRFPHDLAFITNLLSLYQQHDTYNDAAWQKLLSEHWFESDVLRSEFFEYLARSAKLDAALASLHEKNVEISQSNWTSLVNGNPAAARFLVDAELWQSHFEESAPAAGALAAAYPADVDLGRQASSLYRSLAYFQPSDTEKATAIEKQLLDSEPGSIDTLARIGDIYADRGHFADAAPYWLRMAEVHAGEENGYLQSATVFWDYFDFDNALTQIEKARRELLNPALFSYEAGAIYESRRNYSQAVAEYVRGAVTDSADLQCRNRLLTLARRPALRQPIADATASLGAANNPSMVEITLRVDILNALQRRTDSAAALDNALSRSSSFDVLESIEQLARQQSFVRVQQHAIERQIAITTDPVRRMELRYSLVRFYEENGQPDAAQREIDALYQENPKILGVVRATVDYEWAHDRRTQAVAVLEQASGSAYPELANKFRFETAVKLTELEQYVQARAVVTELLKTSPHDAAYLAAVADTYARAGDDAGLRDFYLAQIAGLRTAAMKPAEKTAAIATLRRGLIPALIRLKDAAGAADQYIELINAYPDDESLATEAALFAMRYGQQERLAAFYGKTVDASPRDSRWMIVLARIQTTLENYPAAIEAYTKATVVRPDRADLYIARAGLDEKLQRYDQAASDYDKLCQLSYKDSSWLQKEAETRLRQGRPEEAVTTLKTALIGEKNAKAADYFAAARQLESWNLLSPAQELAEKGVSLASDDLLADYANQPGAVTYVRILTRLGKPDAALARMNEALTAAGKLPGIAATFQHVEEAGVGSVTEKDWREQQRQTRLSIARTGFVGGLREMSATAQTYDTPEEKKSFVQLMRVNAAKVSNDDLRQLYLPAVESSTYPALEAEWKWRLALTHTPETADMWSSWAQLQRQRLLLAAAGKDLEAFAPTTATDVSQLVYASATQFYRDAGEGPSELRVLGKIRELRGDLRERYFALMLARKPQEMTGLAGSGTDESRDAATQYAIFHAPAALALQTINARGAGLPPVWTHGYSALTAYFLHQQNEATDGAFHATLGDGSIAERLATPVDRNQQLAGDLWFYYGARYGEYLSLGNSADTEDYLPASIEQQPENASAYIGLAEWYADHSKLTEALSEYDYALQLAPDSPTIYDSKALLLSRLGKKSEALEAWKQAVVLLLKQIDLKRVPDSFWTDFARIVGAHAARFQFAAVRPQIDATLRVYIKRNGSYMTEPLLRAVFQADGDANDATSWILDLAAVGNPPESVLESIIGTSWLPAAQKPRVYARLVELERNQVTASEGEARAQAQSRVRQLQAQWIDALIKDENYAEAKRQFDAISADERKKFPGQWLPLELRLAAHDGTLAGLVEAWERDQASVPPAYLLRNVAAGLDEASRNVVLSFIYTSALDAHDLNATNFLGLAEIDIAKGDLSDAIALLNRMVLISQDPSSDLDSAASLLSRTGHYPEALPFLSKLISTVPWRPDYRVRLDEAKLKAHQDEAAALGELAALTANAGTPYATRVQAAQLLLGRNRTENLGSGELNLLSRESVPVSETQKPYFVAARIAAAKTAGVPQRVTLLKEVIADVPQDDSVRIALVMGAIEAKDAHLAISAAKPLLGENVLATVTYGDSAPQEPDVSGADQTLENDRMYGTSESFQRLSKADKVAILSGVAESYLKIDEPALALALFRQALRIEPDAARRKTMQTEMARLRRDLARRATNAARAPLIHATLDQNHPVRPRVEVAQKGVEP
jgi:cellulose synthase operon protein C